MNCKQHGRAQNTNEPRHTSRKCIDEHDCLKNLESGALGSLFIPADRIDTAAKHGAVQYKPARKDQENHENNPDGHIRGES